MYVDAYHDSRKDLVHVAERGIDGKRYLKEYPIDFSFYYEKKGGQHTSIYNQDCDFYTADSKKSFQKEVKKFRQTGMTFESDIKAPFKIFEQYYLNAEPPKLNTAFFDIEVDFDDVRGFAPTEDPFNEITAISVYNNWEEICYSFVVAPPTLSAEEAEKICEQTPNTFLCPDEKSMLLCFLEVIDDADIMTGWNSEGYDIPYVVGRIIRVLGREYARKLCLWGQMPKTRTYERYGKENITFDLIGRVHLDYLQLYRKYTYHELPSYSLDYVGGYEVKEQKVAYKGSLDDLYKYDFAKFILYNRQDTMLMVKIDDKMKLISLTNVLAHENCVLLQTTMGAVALSDQAIILEAHNRGVKVPDRDRSDKSDERENYELVQYAKSLISVGQAADCYTHKNFYEVEEMISKLNTTIAGAYVADPVVGLSKWLGSVDITSLYPSIMMALNISPETIIGQANQRKTKEMLLYRMMQTKAAGFAQAWNGIFTAVEADFIFDKTQDKVNLTFDYARKVIDAQEVTAQQASQFIFNNGHDYNISANGTIFRHDIEGVIPGLLARWFTERKELQAKAAAIGKILYGDDAPTDPEELAKMQEEYEFWDQRQLIKKIQLNSLYGAVTNPGSRFFDQRMGQSITLTGREIARHMAGTINEILTGVKDHVGDCIVYGDTDSAYFSAWPIHEELEKNGFIFNEDNVVELYDSIAGEMNKTFKQYMIDRYNCDPTRAERIKAAREICGTAGLFVKKKRYAINVFDDDGKRPPGGKLKIMGMDTQRADTPGFVQEFLKDVLRKVLVNTSEEEILEFIADFRDEFVSKKPWELGTPKRCNGLTRYSEMENNEPGSRLPGHIRAAYNWNKLKKLYGDNKSMSISDGGKTVFCKLKKNQFNMTSCSYPIDESNLPDWFMALPFDAELMEATLIDKKLDNLIGVIGLDLDRSKHNEILDELFSFGDDDD